MVVNHIEPVQIHTTRLVKSEDLNHHGTLFAGRTAEWFVETGFIAAATLLDPKNVVCLKIHGMHFSKPVHPGHILKFTSKVVFAGESSLVSYVEVVQEKTREPYVSGFITFIHVDESTKPAPHYIDIVPKTQEDYLLYEEAKALKAR